MNLNKLKMYELDFKQTHPYFIEHINYDNELTNCTIKTIDFNNGVFFALLPKKANINKIYNFNYGGILPDLPSNKGYPPSYILKPTIKNEMAEFFYTYLLSNESNLAFLDCAIASPSDPHLLIDGSTLKIINNEIFYLLTNNSSFETVKKVLRKSSSIWHLLALLSSGDTEKIDIKSICKNAIYAITTAYDGEGYIIWKKNKQ